MSAGSLAAIIETDVESELVSRGITVAPGFVTDGISPDGVVTPPPDAPETAVVVIPVVPQPPIRLQPYIPILPTPETPPITDFIPFIPTGEVEEAGGLNKGLIAIGVVGVVALLALGGQRGAPARAKAKSSPRAKPEDYEEYEEEVL